MKQPWKALGLALSAAVGSMSAFGDEPTPPPIAFYGFVLPTIQVASGAVESFSQPNMSAYTAAGNPVLGKRPADARGSFEVVQSRFGFTARPVAGTLANVEFDFIDFTKASPTTAALPRLRRAYIDWKANDQLLLRIGQDWDLISPLGPHSFNFVGHYFQTGDIGFMRLQAQAIYSDGRWEHALAVGLPGNNNTPVDSGLELTHLPSVALRETYRFSDKSRLGVSLFAAGFLPKTTDTKKLFAGTATAFFETALGSDTELRTEAFIGQNLNNVGLLGLSFGSTGAAAVGEAGAWVTARSKLGEHFAVFGGFGGSWILNPSAVTPSYGVVAGETKLTGTGPGIVSNWTARLGGEFLVNDKLKLFSEAASLATTHVLLPADAAKYDAHRTAVVLSVGTMASF